MNRSIIWVASPAVFSLIGLLAAYLTDPSTTIFGTGIGLVAGFMIAAFAVAGEK